MTPKRLAEIRAHGAIPWRRAASCDEHGEDGSRTLIREGFRDVCHCDNADADTILAARDDIADLLAHVDTLAAERDEARAMLGECYVLSGADPDGDDWPHLWRRAVAEVRTMREEHDAEAMRAADAAVAR